MANGAGVPASLELLDPGFRVNSVAVRAAAAQHWYANTPLGPAILTYDDCVALQQHKGLGQAGADHLSAQGITAGPVAETWAAFLLNINGPHHARLRRIVAPAFNSTAIGRLRPRMRSIVDQLVDEFSARGRCEFMSEFADRYPPRVMFDLLGIPTVEHEQFLDWGNDLAYLLSYDMAAQADRVAAAIAGIGDVTDRLCAERQAAPGADLLSTLVAARGDELLTQAEIRTMVVTLVIGGQDSTRHQLGLGMATFAEYPDQWALLAQRPELSAAATEEILRFNSTAPIMWRRADIDVDYRDLHIPAGTRLWLFLGLAHRESGAAGVDDPFDIAAEHRPFLGFGHGPHFCLGAGLARLEMTEALSILARRLPGLALDGPGEYRPELAGFVGPERLPIRFTPTSPSEVSGR
ncbi:cytochrome P450 [Nocardia colli]|nr:cytochrome P450 [Nocardia colli]